MIRVAPADGMTVRDPETFIALPVEGAEVPESEFWMRRLADGDVILVSAAAPTEPKTKKTS